MGRPSEELKLADGKVVVTSDKLPYEKAEDILPDIMMLVARVTDRIKVILPRLMSLEKDEDIIAVLPLLTPAVVSVAEQMGGGTLKRLVPFILETTTVVMKDERGVPERLELMKAADRAKLFDEYPETYFRILYFAGRVTFGRFFPVRDLIAQGLPKAG